MPPRDLAIYLFLTVGLSIPIWYPVAVPSAGDLDATFIIQGTSLVAATIAAIGMRVCYLRNGGSAGVDFANRFVSLAWVVGFRLGILYVLLLVAAVQMLSIDTLLVTRVGIVVFQLLYFWQIAVHISRTNAAARHAV